MESFYLERVMMKTETFEEKLEYSKELLEKLMKPDITLEDSVNLYEEGLKNIKEAQQLIEDAKTKISIIEQSNQETDDE
jgi:exodeoxyribonuclease VII small subunit